MSPQTRTTAAPTAATAAAAAASTAAAAAASTASASTPILATTTGLTVTTYANSGLAPPALASFNQPDTGNITFPPAALSAIVSGTLTFPSLGLWSFDCDFVGTNVAFLWVDGHLVCQDGNTYQVAASSTDNPLPVRRVTTFAFRIHVVKDAGAAASVAVRWAHRPLLASGVGPPRPGLPRPSVAPIPIPASALVPALSEPEQRRDLLQRSASFGWGNLLHHNMLTFTQLPAGIALTTTLCSLSSRKCIDVAVPDGLQRSNSYVRVGPYAIDRSYGQYYFGGGPDDRSTLPFGNLSVAFSVQGAGGQAAETEGAGEDVGPKQSGSSMQVLISPIGCKRHDTTTIHGGNGGDIGGESGADIDGDTGVDCSDLVLRVNGRFLWHRAGSVSVSRPTSTMSFHPTGLPAAHIAATAPFIEWDTPIPRNMSSPSGTDVFLRLDGGPLGLVAASSSSLPPPPSARALTPVTATEKVTLPAATPTPAAVAAVVAKARAAHAARQLAKFGSAESAEVATAVEAAASWTAVSTPAENGYAVLMPVSRAWSRVPPSGPDWSYAIFDWDNLFASLLAGSQGESHSSDRGSRGDGRSGAAPVDMGKAIAYSNVIQSFKSKTAEGYLANCAGGGYVDEKRKGEMEEEDHRLNAPHRSVKCWVYYGDG